VRTEAPTSGGASGPPGSPARNRKLARICSPVLEAALGFWGRHGQRTAWLLTALIVAGVLLNLFLQYRLNVWHRVMFDALDRRDGAGVLRQTAWFFPLIAALVGVAGVATYLKLSLQRRWRAWLNGHVLDQWLTRGRYYQLNLVPGEHSNPEHRVAEDLRLSVEAPVSSRSASSRPSPPRSCSSRCCGRSAASPSRSATPRSGSPASSWSPPSSTPCWPAAR
jgi:hypothetical protein